VSGVGSTSDSKWDDFERQPGEAAPVPGSKEFTQGARGGAAPAPQKGQTGPRPMAGGPPPIGSRPAAPAAAPAQQPKPAAPKAPGEDEGFEIERF
jgi:hypothetical protein